MKLRNTRMYKIEPQLTINRELCYKATNNTMMFRVSNKPGTYYVRIQRSTGEVFVEHWPCRWRGERIDTTTTYGNRDHRELARTITRIVKSHSGKVNQGK